MENKAFVSVIVPIYNSAQYLRKCIDSILVQSYRDLELLLINDGSEDASGAICDDYAQIDHRVRVFHQENSGVSAARNIMELIFFLLIRMIMCKASIWKN